MTLEMKRIESKSHQIKMYNINKIFLSCFNDEIKKLGFGHKDIKFGFGKSMGNLMEEIVQQITN